jgi:hypothetical protein
MNAEKLSGRDPLVKKYPWSGNFQGKPRCPLDELSGVSCHEGGCRKQPRVSTRGFLHSLEGTADNWKTSLGAKRTQAGSLCCIGFSGLLSDL